MLLRVVLLLPLLLVVVVAAVLVVVLISLSLLPVFQKRVKNLPKTVRLDGQKKHVFIYIYMCHGQKLLYWGWLFSHL